MNSSTLLIGNRHEDTISLLRLRTALRRHGFNTKLELMAGKRVIHGHRVEIGNETLLYRIRNDYVSITHYRTLKKSGLKNSFKSAFIFLSILAKALPEVKMMRADIQPQLDQADTPMSGDRMIEFYVRKHGAVIYERENGLKWVEWSLDNIRSPDLNQPKYLNRILHQHYSS